MDEANKIATSWLNWDPAANYPITLSLLNINQDRQAANGIVLQARYIVEMEIILPQDMTVRESHDLSLDLQHKVRSLNLLHHGNCVSYYLQVRTALMGKAALSHNSHISLITLCELRGPDAGLYNLLFVRPS